MDLSGKDLNLMVALKALLEEANVTRAGARLEMSQSSMSSALSRLRAIFSDELLVRVGRDYELTPLARLILPQVQVAMPLVETALGKGEAFEPTRSHRTFKILISDFAMVELSKRIFEILTVAPNISIEALPLPPSRAESDYLLTVNDFVVAVPGMGIEASSKELFTDHYVCVLDKDNEAVQNGDLTWEAFMKLPHAVCDFGDAHLTPADRRLYELGFIRKPQITTTSILSLPQVVSGTDLVAVVPSRMASEAMLGATNTVAVEAPFGRVDLVELLFWHPVHSADPSHSWLRYCLENPEVPVPTEWPLAA